MSEFGEESDRDGSKEGLDTASFTCLDSVETDGVFEALRHPRRRLVVRALAEESKGMSVDTLTDWVRTSEGSAPAASPPDGDDIRISLHHTHLPYLAARGIVALDGDDVRLTADAAVLSSLLKTFEVIDLTTEAL